MSKSHLSAVKTLAKGKDNLNNPWQRSTTGRRIMSQLKKSDSIKTGMFFLSRKIVGNVTKWLTFLYTFTALLNTRANNCLF